MSLPRHAHADLGVFRGGVGRRRLASVDRDPHYRLIFHPEQMHDPKLKATEYNMSSDAVAVLGFVALSR